MLLIDFEKELHEQAIRLKKTWMVAIHHERFDEAHRLRELMDSFEKALEKLMWFHTTKTKHATEEVKHARTIGEPTAHQDGKQN